MKPSARLASILILLFFICFNALQVFLILERISETKTKFDAACSAALISTIGEYDKLKAMDSASTPDHGWIAFAQEKIEMSRLDTHKVTLNAPLSYMAIDTVQPGLIRAFLNNQAFRSIDLAAFDRLYKKALLSKNIHAIYRLDTITFEPRQSVRPMIQEMWTRKRTRGYPYATRPLRLPYNSNISVFAEVKTDDAFVRNDLLWPLLAFAAILLIGNTALVFVYQTIKKQTRINELKTDFINNITHEMKTPITIASAGLDALEHHVPPNERTNFYLHTSKRQLHLLNEFVERIVDAAVQDLSDFTLKKEEIDLHALFGELVRSYSILQEKPVNFQLNGEGPVLIHGDRLHLETAFRNVIDNAIKYSNGSVNIDIDLVENSRDCTIKIRDNGMGIPPQYLKSVFEKFFRVPQGDAQSVKGFGLGLYYVSSIIKKHSGNITVQSKGQTGTQFNITLPKEL
ncbi:sensor histidine kinase [Aridibaculum aurantiacum]|uniref:sensor histidine kinase n=1 Tax=Aridibaculum aurantiacum TaxID=2810307 RepID=UPI001A959CB1|nr:HAMP domain-containing sensor histidine kinase [Aridibaculum aurantiacum]